MEAPAAGLFDDLPAATPSPDSPAAQPSAPVKPRPRRRSSPIIGARPRRTRSEIRQQAAQEIADRLLSLARRFGHTVHVGGQPDVHNPATWHAVALALGLKVRLEYKPGAGRGEYQPAMEEGACLGVVAINVAYPAREVAAAWVHELGHHHLVWWPQPPLFIAEGLSWEYGGDRRVAQHDVAARVERLVVGQIGEALAEARWRE